MARQEDLNLNLPDSVAVVGCGGVGSWTAYFLALAGVKELWLFDMDTISDHNLNRIPVPINTIGQKKTEAIKQLILSVRPNCKVLAMGMFSAKLATQLNLSNSIDWIVATTDTLASRKEVNKWTKKAWSVKYIEAAAEGEMGSIADSPAEWASKLETDPGYQHVPVWVGPCVFAAAMATAHIVHGYTLPSERVIRMGWEGADCRFNITDTDMKVNLKESEDEVA